MSAAFTRLRAALDHAVIRWGRRVVRYLLLTVAVVLAVALVTAVTIDLGPVAKKYAEQSGSQFLERPLHIGRVSFRLVTGNFVFDDLRIDGITPESRPFLVAKRIEVSIPWGTLVDRRFVLRSIEMTDWDMYVEVLPDGRHSLPRLTPRTSTGRRSSWTTTVEWVRTHRGQFTFEDHATPWRVITRNLDVTVARPSSEYRGQVSFSNGEVKITDYLPFRADMDASFKIDGSRVLLERIDLVSDGARSKVTGDVNLKYWPEQMFRVESTIDFKRMRELFFANEQFALTGTGRFEGYFHLFKEPLADGTNRTGRELFGTFRSPRVGTCLARTRQGGCAPESLHQFENLNGSVRWSPEKLVVSNARASLHGGQARFRYEMSPLGRRGVRPTAAFGATFDGIDVFSLSEFAQLEGVRLAGRAAGRVNLRWPLGRFASRQIDADVQIAPPAGVTLMTRRVPVELIEAGRLPRGPAAPLTPLIPIPIGASLSVSSTAGQIVLRPSQVATQRTYVEFEGQTGSSGENTTLPFFVASADWQESYDVFAAMMTAFGSRTTTIDLGGYGTFEGQLTNDIRRPRIEGTFAGERMRAFDQEWGSARGRAVIENGYADVRETTISMAGSVIETDGRYSLGFPRRDGGEEINARVRISGRPLSDLRHAFGLDRYPVDGLLSGEFHVYGNFREPFGYGEMELTEGRAYGEPFASAAATVALEGKGVRLTGIEVHKGAGRGTGAAYVSWDGDYSFDFTGDAIPVEDVALAEKAPLPLSGLVDFTARGSGTFDKPRYTVSGRIRDLFAADEGIGQVAGDLIIVGDTMTVTAKAASPRLALSMDGTIELDGSMHSQLSIVVHETSLDPYVRALNPALSPYTTAVVSGTVRVAGELTNLEALEIDTLVERVDLELFDYRLQNGSPFRIVLDRNSVSIPEMTLFGDLTKLALSATVRLDTEEILMNAKGDANLALVQGFVPNVRSTGNASLSATVSGDFRDPDVNGTLRIDNGRIRHFDAPNALEEISGVLAFDSRGVTFLGLNEQPFLTAQIGDGPVQIGGTIEKVGLLPSRFDLTIAGQGMRVRYPAGMRPVIDADLTLQGTLDDMRLGGDVFIRNASYERDFPTNVFQLLTGDEAVAGPPGPSFPLTYDSIRITGPSSIRIENSGENSARISATPFLELRGTFDRPILSGDLELDPGGELRFLGKRYTVTQGTVSFNNPNSIEPTFDIEGEARVRAPGETYRITVNLSGAFGRSAPRPRVSFNSDPSLSQVEIMALLFGDVAPGQDVELTRLQRDSERQKQILQELATRIAASPVSSQVSAYARAFGVDTVQITPSISNPDPLSSRLEPCARLQLGKRLSTRAYLTYSRSLCSTTRDEIVLFEYDATDRLSWVLSRNEDQTYAIEVRMRHAF